MSTFASKARAIASYFASRRQRGHSTVQREGYARHPKTTVVVHNWNPGPGQSLGAISLLSPHFESLLVGFDTPLVIEHEALRLLLDGLLREMDQLQTERQSWIETARQSARDVAYYQGLIDRALAREPAAYEGDDGSKHLEPLRAKLPEIAEKYRADIAHRDRALRYVADTLAMFGRADAGAIVENALACTRNGAQPVRVTVQADVAPLLRALDELSCALRGVKRPS